MLHAGRLLEDAHNDPHYRSWLGKVQAALRHCCGRALRQELELEARLVSALVEVAKRVRMVDKTRRKVGTTQPSGQLTLETRHFCSVLLLQTALKKAKWKIREFFEDGVSCCLPLDPAVRVKALDVEVGATHRSLLSSHISPIVSQ